jgi:hypothetical protein
LRVFDPVTIYPVILLRVARCKPGLLHLKCPLPEFYGNNDALLVAASVIHVLDFIHCIIIIPAREYSFPEKFACDLLTGRWGFGHWLFVYGQGSVRAGQWRRGLISGRLPKKGTCKKRIFFKDRPGQQ